MWQSLYRQGKEGLREVGQLVLGWCELKHPCDLIRSGRFRVQNRPQSGESKEGRDFLPNPQLHLLESLKRNSDFMLVHLADTLLPLHNFHKFLSLEFQKVRTGGKFWDPAGTAPSFS